MGAIPPEGTGPERPVGRSNRVLTPLDALPSGVRGVVVAVRGDDLVAGRLSDLGFWPGAEVDAGLAAPLGGPRVYHLHGFRLALRPDEARRVHVRSEPARPRRGGRR